MNSLFEYFDRFSPAAWFDRGITSRDDEIRATKKTPTQSAKASIVFAASWAVMTAVATPVASASTHEVVCPYVASAHVAEDVDRVPPNHFAKIVSLIDHAKAKQAKREFVEIPPLY